MTLPYLLWPLGAGIIATGLEILFRRGGDWQWWWVIPAAAINYFLYRAFREAPSLLAGAVTVSVFLVVLRALASQFVLGESVTRGVLVAAIALTVGAIVSHTWR